LSGQLTNSALSTLCIKDSPAKYEVRSFLGLPYVGRVGAVKAKVEWYVVRGMLANFADRTDTVAACWPQSRTVAMEEMLWRTFVSLYLRLCCRYGKNCASEYLQLCGRARRNGFFKFGCLFERPRHEVQTFEQNAWSLSVIPLCLGLCASETRSLERAQHVTRCGSASNKWLKGTRYRVECLGAELGVTMDTV